MSKQRTFGDIKLRKRPGSLGGGELWEILATPDVAMRLKRIFTRADSSRKGTLSMENTPEVCRDIEWVLERWPMIISNKDRKRLVNGADQHRQIEQVVLEVLGGTYKPSKGTLEPSITPRDYQLIAADLASKSGRLLIGDDIGLGKTITSLLALRDPANLPAIVICPTHLPKQWQQELNRTFPQLKSHILRKGTPYDISATREMKGEHPDVLICNYAKIAGWAEHLVGKVNTVIFDEVQELRRKESLKYNAAGRIADSARCRIGLSATPVYNFGGEIHSIVNVLDKDALGEEHEFVREWGQKDLRGRIRISDPAALGTYLRNQGLMIRRTRKEVGRELPEITRIPHIVDLDESVLNRVAGDALSLAELIVEKRGTQSERWRASGELDLRMRQATGVAKAKYVAAFAKMLLESEEKIVLFGWHHDVYDIWAEQLRGHHPVFYTGKESAVQKEASRMAFMEGDSQVLIMSLRSGAGIDGLQEVANVAVFGELDWSPGMHDQAIGRLHRDGIDGPAVAYFLIAEEGSDPVMAETLGIKRQQSEPIRDPSVNGLEPISESDSDRIEKLAASIIKRS